jgi:hypothetical protein
MMRIRTLSLAACIALTTAVSSHAQTATSSFGSVLTGSIQSPICSSENFASGEATGDLRGAFYLAFDCQDGAIFGGTWLILVTAEAADGTIEVRGSIRGQVMNGEFDTDAETGRITVRSVALIVTEATGEYATLAGGTGSLDATSDPAGTPQFVGTLGLSL